MSWMSGENPKVTRASNSPLPTWCPSAYIIVEYAFNFQLTSVQMNS